MCCSYSPFCRDSYFEESQSHQSVSLLMGSAHLHRLRNVEVEGRIKDKQKTKCRVLEADVNSQSKISRGVWCRAWATGGVNNRSHIGFYSDAEPVTGCRRAQRLSYFLPTRLQQRYAEVTSVFGCLCCVMLTADWSYRRNVLTSLALT